MAEMLPFELYPFDENDAEHKAVKAHIEADRLPADTLFRLAAVGLNQVDPRDDRRGLQYMLLRDIIDHADNWPAMRPASVALLQGDLPNAIVDIDGPQYKAYRQLDPMYYAVGDLARVIRESRAERGRSATEVPPGYWRGELKDYEWQLCVGLARPIWRTLIQRIHPEWLAQPEVYYPDRTFSFLTRYDLSPNTVRRRLLGRAVISDSVVLSLYEEAEHVGMKGIGPQGKESLRRLLEDEHLELSRDVSVTAEQI